jgi:anti-sigma regulatory factor (Ser/Thr protein kinase)
VSPIRESRDRPHELRLDLPAAHSAERMARTVLRHFAQGEGVPPPEIETLEFVASELLSNAVDHGGGERAMEESDRPGDVRMSLFLEITGGRWTLEIGDQGGGDPRDVERLLSRSDPPDLEDERGRGFFLLASMLESLTVSKSEDGRGLVFRAVREHGRARA